jgi:DNA repair protein RadC
MTDYISIKNWANDDKPREKLAQQGRTSLSNTELIAILISNGTKNKSALDLAREILQLADNDLNNLSKMSIADFCKINGVGPAKAISLIAAIELGGRRKKATQSSNIIKSSRDAYHFFNLCFKIKTMKSFGYSC